MLVENGQGPDGATKSEIDFISNHNNIVKNVRDLNKFIVGSDHWMVIVKLVSNIKQERHKLITEKESTAWASIERQRRDCDGLLR